MVAELGYVILDHLWMFMRDAGVGTAHVALMRARAKKCEIDGRIPLARIGEVIGEPELEQRFLHCGMGDKYVPMSTAVDSDL